MIKKLVTIILVFILFWNQTNLAIANEIKPFINKENQSKISNLIISTTTTYDSITKSLQKVPKNFKELVQEMPKVAQKVKRAGVRTSLKESLRLREDAFKMFQKIPGAILMDSTDTVVRGWLANKHGSHIISKKHGGSNDSNNMFWELDTLNLARGAVNTTKFEQLLSRIYNATEAIVKNGKVITKLGLQSVSTAVVIDYVVEAAIYSGQLAKGNITSQEYFQYINKSAQKTALTTIVFYSLTVFAISACPELVTVLSTPVIIHASEVILGSMIAIPLLRYSQSLFKREEIFS